MEKRERQNEKDRVIFNFVYIKKKAIPSSFVEFIIIIVIIVLVVIIILFSKDKIMKTVNKKQQ